MASQKYYERLLVVAVIFFVFFVITVTGLPVIMQKFHILRDTRSGMLTISIIQALILFIAPSFVAARLISNRPLAYLEFNKAPGWLPVIGVVFAYLIALPALNQIIYWNANLEFPDHLSHWGSTLRELEDSANKAANIMLFTPEFGAMIINLLVVGLLTAFGEELFFRGTLQHTATPSGAHHLAIWIVAFLFSAMHFQIFGFIPRLLLGAWFGYLLYWTKSIYIPVLAHFINNGVVVVCVWLAANGFSYDFDKFGVVDSGFPYPALVSALATFIFLFCFRNFFFKGSSYAGRRELENSLQVE